MNVYYFHHQADELLGTASEQFLGKSVKEIKMTILQTLEGHLRAILGKWSRWDECTTSITNLSDKTRRKHILYEVMNVNFNWYLFIITSSINVVFIDRFSAYH